MLLIFAYQYVKQVLCAVTNWIFVLNCESVLLAHYVFIYAMPRSRGAHTYAKLARNCVSFPRALYAAFSFLYPLNRWTLDGNFPIYTRQLSPCCRLLNKPIFFIFIIFSYFYFFFFTKSWQPWHLSHKQRFIRLHNTTRRREREREREGGTKSKRQRGRYWFVLSSWNIVASFNR